MSARHARPHPASSDLLGSVLSWLWALGTAIGFVCLAASVDGELGNRDASSHPAFTTPEAAEFAAV